MLSPTAMALAPYNRDQEKRFANGLTSCSVIIREAVGFVYDNREREALFSADGASPHDAWRALIVGR